MNGAAAVADPVAASDANIAHAIKVRVVPIMFIPR